MPRLNTRQADIRKEMEHLDISLEANTAEIPHLEAPRIALRGLLTEIRSLTTDQDLHRASKQQTSKRLEAALNEGRKLVTFLRTGLKQHYGNRNEKLVEFGVQPFRSRPRELKSRPKPQISGDAEPAPVEPRQKE